MGQLVSLAQRRGWDVCVLTTPSARRFTDPGALERQTGHPVRSEYKNPGEPDVLPDPDAVIVAPATVNTINKWAAGICDTLALGILVEAIGKRLPIVALPSTSQAHAAHPAFAENIGKLRSWGVSVLFGAGVHALAEPGASDSGPGTFPWAATLDALRAGPARRRRDPRHRPGTAVSRGAGRGIAATVFATYVWAGARPAIAEDTCMHGAIGLAIDRMPAAPEAWRAAYGEQGSVHKYQARRVGAARRRVLLGLACSPGGVAVVFLLFALVSVHGGCWDRVDRGAGPWRHGGRCGQPGLDRLADVARGGVAGGAAVAGRRSRGSAG